MKEYKIYPKQFLYEKIPIEKNRCFMLMPFSEDFDYIYGVIKKDLNDNGLICNRADEIAGSKPILNKILTEILKSRYIIADLTRYNPNVFYELGIAHSFKDAQNILLLKQKESKIPFDLTHLTYIEYTPDNLRFLTATIKNFIRENEYLSNFHESLNLHGITTIISENREIFIDYLQEYFSSRISMITDILNESCSKYNQKELAEFFNDYEALIIQTISENNIDIADGIVKTYFYLLSNCENNNIMEQFVYHFINGLFTIFNNTYKEEILTWETELMILLAQKKRLLHMSMPWIIEYFSRSKSSSIDLNRYKLESFLMTSDDNDIDQIIANSVFDNNCYIREHMADIIGEKKIYSAKNNLIKQLFIEQNYFTMGSIVEAIAKIGDTESLDFILKWLSEKEKVIISDHQYFLFKHIFKAIVLLDNTPEQKYVQNFQEKYKDYMNSLIAN